MYESKILNAIEAAIAGEEQAQPEPLVADKWLASSCLQKSVRRGEPERAIQAATSLWEQDRRNFWHRVITICVEDCGVASPDVIVKTLTAFNASAWRKRNNDLKIGLYLIRLMCEATKLRLADEIFLIAAHASEYQQHREALAKQSNQALADMVLDSKAPLLQRAIALWFLAGSKRYVADNMPVREGSLDMAAEVLRALKAPCDLMETCIATLRKTPYPLALFAPLLFEVVQGQTTCIKHNALPAAPHVANIPTYAMDVYTRGGQSCFRQLQKAVPEFKRFNIRQIGVAVFYIEGGLLDKFLTSPFLEELCQAGEAADAEGAGLSPDGYQQLRSYLTQHMNLLNNIRQDELRRYVNAIQGKPTITYYVSDGGTK